MLFINYFSYMNLKKIVAILGIIGLTIGLILPFLNYTEDGQKIDASQTELTTTSTASVNTGTSTTTTPEVK